jgi:lipopolysaccharide/colanic/teichoic acid biosynthesis glycosyltransferase
LYVKVVKPLADWLAALFLLLALLPIMALIALILWIKYGKSGIFFIQIRPGLHGQPFRMLKFKSMHPATAVAGSGETIYTISPIGNLLRKTSLDELPQLINVLAGQMSLVGPRPLLTEYLPLYSVRQAQRHNVKPGITGLAQIIGRNSIPWSRKLAADVYYAKNLGFILDMRILLGTIIQVFKSRQNNFSSTETMPFFTGSKANNKP